MDVTVYVKIPTRDRQPSSTPTTRWHLLTIETVNKAEQSKRRSRASATFYGVRSYLAMLAHQKNQEIFSSRISDAFFAYDNCGLSRPTDDHSPRVRLPHQRSSFFSSSFPFFILFFLLLFIPVIIRKPLGKKKNSVNFFFFGQMVSTLINKKSGYGYAFKHTITVHNKKLATHPSIG